MKARSAARKKNLRLVEPAEAAKAPGEALSSHAAVLRQLPLFRDLDSLELERIADRMQEMAVEPGVELLSQNKPTPAVYLLKQGAVEILVNGELVASKTTHECFGEMSVLMGELNASATVRTAAPSQILRISRDEFLEAVNQVPKLWRQLFHQMTGRFRDTNNRMSEVLAHTPQGLLKVDRNGTITQEFSIHCTKYLGTRALAGKNFPDLAFRADPAKKKAWEGVYPVLFAQHDMDFDLLVGLLPKETRIPSSEGKGSREYVLTYYPCRSKDGAVVALDVGMEDVTDVREFERRTAALEREKQVRQRFYDNPDSYMGMIDMLEVTLSLLDALRDPGPPPDFVEVLRTLHSLKGLTGQFGLESARDVIHGLEERVKELEASLKGMPTGDANEVPERGAVLEALARETGDLRKEYLSATALVENISPDLRQRLLGIVIPKEEYPAFRDALSQGRLAEVNALLDQIERVDARKLFHGWNEEIRRLAQRLGKQVIFKLGGESVQIPKTLFARLGPAVQHLMRNAIDHGIEKPEVRQAAGKNPAGTFYVLIQRSPDGLRLEFRDDGRGLNLDRIAERARRNPQLDRQQVETLIAQGEIPKILFLPGFSTADNVTDISGRGVGLDAVRDAVEAVGGTVTVDSELGQKTTFAVLIPLQ